MADNGHSATDIITYIGVPLAVLGVLPILYNTVFTLVNTSKIKRMLRHSRLTALTRSDVVNRVIEIELPRYAVTPWDRFEHRREYWSLSRNPSAIPGGSWTTFNWKTNAIGFKTQRVEYADQLRQPQVDVAFDELVAYLLDLGAVPEAQGWRLLRSTGLWTPVGCVLLTSPDGQHTALSLAPLNDSDGNLSLAVSWRPEWTSRSYSDLPPYWVSLPAPPPPYQEREEDGQEEQAQGEKESKTETVADQTAEQTHTAPDTDANTEAVGVAAAVASSSSTASRPPSGHGSNHGDAGEDNKDSSNTGSKDKKAADAAGQAGAPKASMDSATRAGAAQARVPITCQISVNGIITALTQAKHTTIPTTTTTAAASAAAAASIPDSLYIEHLRIRPHGRTDGVWFASAATAYGTTSQTILWNYRIPDDLLAFARRATVPCGVLVLLRVVDEAETPSWATSHTGDDAAALDLFVQRINEQRAAQAVEQRMPAKERQIAVRERMMRESRQRIHDMQAKNRQDRERSQQREMEALHSAPWATGLVAARNLRWLHENKHVPATRSRKEVVGHVLHRMVRDGQYAAQLCGMLDRWKAWAELGGMKVADLQALREKQVLFAEATLLVALIEDASTALEGTLSVDLQECLRMWRKVRLG
ncbi:hypothetical protein SPI_05098 [Niveomyces insectorum RCEF 264]|uniref:Uncharacterized protein n=1 Tax=Niveomyces insectorum RCEF 264 TaxID=1081102 RepID=A0A167TYB8_9HYPO|nr:hypothetical protein SPI_05098 [Niveomyces insectorum RCEF 264]